MLLETRAVPPFQKNGYRRRVRRPPGRRPDRSRRRSADVARCRRRQKLTVQSILLTHAHVDHVTGVAPAQEGAGRAGVPSSRRSVSVRCGAQQAAFFGLHCGELPPIDITTICRRRCRLVTTRSRAPHAGTLPGRCLPGHRQTGSPKQDLFVGDTLFAGSIGRTDLPGGDYAT